MRERRLQRKATGQRRSWLIWGIALLAVGLVLYLLVSPAIRGPYGEGFPLQEGKHIPDGTDPGQYSSNPPSSGRHYVGPLDAGFYEEADLAQMGPFPYAFAVHNLEHGYIVFWYNCDLLDESACEELKAEIRDYMGSSFVSKLAAFPWHDTNIPLVLASWGYLLEMPVFNASEASRFIDSNRLRAPEPNAP